MNAREMIRKAAASLREAGVPDPEYDSALLLSSLMGIPPLELRMGTEIHPDPQQEEAYGRLIQRRRSREPLQYILGTVYFRGMEFQVSPEVLIPRPETELLAEWAAEEMQGRPSPEILDVCCGSGCLGLSMKRALPGGKVTLSDLSPGAVRIARLNRDRQGLEAEILQGDLLEPVAGRRFDLILCNPPYIPSRDCEELQPEVMREPRLALDGGADGMDFFRRLSGTCPAYLKPGGLLMMEVGIGEAREAARMLREHGAVRAEIRKDDSQIERMVLGAYA